MKYIIIALLNGGYIRLGEHKHRLLDSRLNPLIWIKPTTFDKIRDILRKTKLGFVINKTKVRQLHGNCKIKKQYKKYLKISKI